LTSITKGSKLSTEPNGHPA